ncbi:hypothetical protein OG884_04235 [Streptosporangium sp. NBC_01755]|uniref:hypothetical protein n=1 Tax=Streptosporangium sp. NBC_01755 TaxID=2975949 RepID=UPI002DD8179E|nr:hypothetical protein [Streptosporangium sp. NBC_01755]WSD01155.1 hypothetical protein OG884_04235 [Streptosporangium sp. NBC_01755]
MSTLIAQYPTVSCDLIAKGEKCTRDEVGMPREERSQPIWRNVLELFLARHGFSFSGERRCSRQEEEYLLSRRGKIISSYEKEILRASREKHVGRNFCFMF